MSRLQAKVIAREITNQEPEIDRPISGPRILDRLRHVILTANLGAAHPAASIREWIAKLVDALRETTRSQSVVFHEFHPPVEGVEFDPDQCWSWLGGATESRSDDFAHRQTVEEIRGESFRSKKAVLRTLHGPSPSTHDSTSIFAIPFFGLHGSEGVFVCQFETDANSKLALKQLAADVRSIQDMMCVRLERDEQQVQNQQLAAILELNQEVRNEPSVRSCLLRIADRLKSFWDLGSVAISVCRRDNPRRVVISESADHQVGDERRVAFREAMLEAIVHGGITSTDGDGIATGIFPKHHQLAENESAESVCSFFQPSPIPVVITICGDRASLLQHQIQAALPLFSEHVAESIREVERAHRGLTSRIAIDLMHFVTNRWTAILAIFIALTAWLMLLPATYRIRCSGELVAQDRKFVVAPFDGLVAEAIAKEGDRVLAGDRLAVLDQSELRLQEESLKAEIRSLATERDQSLANRLIPEAVAADLKVRKLQADLELISKRRQKTVLIAPVDGILLHRAEDLGTNAPVRKGEELFQVAPLDRLQLEVYIPSSDISKAKPGQRVTCWCTGNLDRPVLATIQSIRPRSTMVDGENVFTALVEIQNRQFELHPGMDFSVAIECDQQTLGWNLFHKSHQWLQARIGW